MTVYIVEILILLFGYGVGAYFIKASMENEVRKIVTPMLEKIEKIIEKKQDKELCAIVHLNLGNDIANINRKLDILIENMTAA